MGVRFTVPDLGAKQKNSETRWSLFAKRDNNDKRSSRATWRVVNAALIVLWCLAISVQARADLIGHGGMVRSVTMSADGKQVLTTSFDYSAKLWSFGNQEILQSLEAHEGPVNGGLFLPEDRLATVGDDGQLIFWDAKSGEATATIKAHDHKAMGMALNPRGQLIATASWDRTVKIWNAQSGALVRTLSLKFPINTVTFLADGAVLATGGHDGVINLFRVDDGIALGKLEGHRMAITALQASQDGKTLLSASVDQSLRLWDVAGGRTLTTFEGHDGQVYDAAFGPEENRIYSVGRDGFLIIWDVETAQPIKTKPAHSSIIWDMAVSADGQFAITSGADETVRVWHLATGDRIGLSADDYGSRPEPWEQSDHPGAEVYKSCAKCHAVTADEPQRSGPHFEGIFGRKVGELDGYNYSQALKDADFLWDDESMFQLFHQGPDKFLPGTKMPVQTVPNDQSLRDLIDYMRQLTDPDTNTAATPEE